MMNISYLKGKKVISISGCFKGSPEMNIYTACGLVFRIYHERHCCEEVIIEDVVGDPEDLSGRCRIPILMAEECSNKIASDNIVMTDKKSATWTYYRFGTARADLSVRWMGSSNGYYSEGVSVKIYNEIHHEV